MNVKEAVEKIELMDKHDRGELISKLKEGDFKDPESRLSAQAILLYLELNKPNRL